MNYPSLKNTSLVLEGGGFRGLYTTGILDYFMEQGLYLPAVYGISAGALNGLNYLSHQPGRTAQINFRFCNDKRYISARNMLKYHCAFNMEFMFDVISEEYIPFNYKRFFDSDLKYYAGASNLMTGKCDFFSKEQMDHKLFPARASAALPLFSHIFYLKNQPYLDGGITCPIPVEQAMEDGNTKHIIIMTKQASFIRKPASNLPIVRRVYREYPNFVKAFEERHLVDRHQRDLCNELQAKGQAFIIRPQKAVEVSAMKANEESLRALYAMGYDDAKELFPQIVKFLEIPAE